MSKIQKLSHGIFLAPSSRFDGRESRCFNKKMSSVPSLLFKGARDNYSVEDFLARTLDRIERVGTFYVSDGNNTKCANAGHSSYVALGTGNDTVISNTGTNTLVGNAGSINTIDYLNGTASQLRFFQNPDGSITVNATAAGYGIDTLYNFSQLEIGGITYALALNNNALVDNSALSGPSLVLTFINNTGTTIIGGDGNNNIFAGTGNNIIAGDV